MKSKLAIETKKKLLTDFFGCWQGDKSELGGISKTLEAERKKFMTREVDFKMQDTIRKKVKTLKKKHNSLCGVGGKMSMKEILEGLRDKSDRY